MNTTRQLNKYETANLRRLKKQFPNLPESELRELAVRQKSDVKKAVVTEAAPTTTAPVVLDPNPPISIHQTASLQDDWSLVADQLKKNPSGLWIGDLRSRAQWYKDISKKWMKSTANTAAFARDFPENVSFPVKVAIWKSPNAAVWKIEDLRSTKTIATRANRIVSLYHDYHVPSETAAYFSDMEVKFQTGAAHPMRMVQCDDSSSPPVDVMTLLKTRMNPVKWNRLFQKLSMEKTFLDEWKATFVGDDVIDVVSLLFHTSLFSSVLVMDCTEDDDAPTMLHPDIIIYYSSVSGKVINVE